MIFPFPHRLPTRAGFACSSARLWVLSMARGLRCVPFPKEWCSLLLESVHHLPRGQGHHPASDLEAADEFPVEAPVVQERRA